MQADLLKKFSEGLEANPLGLDLSEFVDFTGWCHDEVERLEREKDSAMTDDS